MNQCLQSNGFNVWRIKFGSFLLQFVIRCPQPIGCFSALHFLVIVFTFVCCVECRVTNYCGLWCRGSDALFQRSSLFQQLICQFEAGPEGARTDTLLFEVRVRWCQRILVDRHGRRRHVFCATRVFSAPHVAWRIACLWLRFVVGVVFVFVELLRLCQSFDTSVFGEVCH